VKVLGYGDNVIDRFLDRGVEYPGGNCVNFAVFSARLGASAGYLGAFGSDEQGEYIRSVLTSIGVDVSRSVVRDGETGLAEVEVVDSERVFRGGNHGGVTTREPIILGDEELAYVSTFDVVHSSVYSTAETELPKLAALDIPVSYDLSSEEAYRSSPYLDDVAPCLDLALLSCSELSEADTGSLLESVVRSGAGMALGTRGAGGAVLFDGRSLHRVAAAPLDYARGVEDTMGCGDAFLAAFVTSLLSEGWRKGAAPDSGAIERGLAAGAAYSTEQCYVSGAFGYGRPVPVVAHDGAVLTEGRQR
jgi:sugar/nucleoside kinase (ribokinase family)